MILLQIQNRKQKKKKERKGKKKERYKHKVLSGDAELVNGNLSNQILTVE